MYYYSGPVVMKTDILYLCSHWRTQGDIKIRKDHLQAGGQMFYTRYHPDHFVLCHKRATGKTLEKRYLFFHLVINTLSMIPESFPQYFFMTGNAEVPCLLLYDIASIDYSAFLLSQCVEVADGDFGSLP